MFFQNLFNRKRTISAKDLLGEQHKDFIGNLDSKQLIRGLEHQVRLMNDSKYQEKELRRKLGFKE